MDRFQEWSVQVTGWSPSFHKDSRRSQVCRRSPPPQGVAPETSHLLTHTCTSLDSAHWRFSRLFLETSQSFRGQSCSTLSTSQPSDSMQGCPACLFSLLFPFLLHFPFHLQQTSQKPNYHYFHLEWARENQRRKACVPFWIYKADTKSNINKRETHIDKENIIWSFAVMKFAFIKTGYSTECLDYFGVSHSPV